jgi:ankyrin repeat protein
VFVSLKMSINFDAFCDHVAQGQLADVQRMLESGDVLFKGKEFIALTSAVKNGHVDVVDCLLRHAIFDPSACNNLAVRLAAERGHLAVVERLLQDKRVDPSADNNHAVRRAAENGHLAVVERLLQDKRVDPAADDNCAVRLAAQCGHLAVVERLLQDPRVDPTTDDNDAVRWAAKRGHLAVVDRLLEDGRVDFTVAIQCSRPEHRKRFECRERSTEICIALQDLALPAWITVQILDAARPWSTLPLHSKWNLVCAVKHFRDRRAIEK